MNGCGLFRWGKSTIVRHIGPDALDLLHRLTTRDLLCVAPGRTRRTVLTSDRGRVVDVLLVAHVSNNQLLLVSDSDDPDRTVSAIDYYTIIADAQLSDVSDSLVRISLVGPTAPLVVESTFDVVVEADTTSQVPFESCTVTIASDTSRGVEWVEIICESAVIDALLSTLTLGGGRVVDDANFELFRIDNEIPGSDREYGEHSNPIEAGLLRLVDFDKGCYVGQEVIARLDAYDKVQRGVVAIRSSVPLPVGAKLTGDSKKAGLVTSTSTLASRDGSYLSLALVRNAFSDSGTVLDADGETVAVR